MLVPLVPVLRAVTLTWDADLEDLGGYTAATSL